MTLSTLLAFSGAGLFLVYALATLRAGAGRSERLWLLPTLTSLAFFAFSLVAVVREGPLGFWPEHTRNLWGNQIWFDLLCAAGLGWGLLTSRARAVGMRPAPWLVLVVSTGSIGLLAYAAVVLFRERQGVGASVGSQAASSG